MNQYVYVGNDPVSLRDPSGLQPEWVSWWTSGSTVTVGLGGGTHTEEGYWSTVCVGTVSGRTVGTGPAVSAPGMGGGIGNRPESTTLMKRSCTEAQVMFGLTVAGDVGFFVGGVGPAARLLGAGVKYGRSAKFFAGSAMYARSNRGAVAIANRNAAFTLAGHRLGTAYAGTFSNEGVQLMSTQAESLSWEDFAPGFATRKAYRHMNAACAQ